MGPPGSWAEGEKKCNAPTIGRNLLKRLSAGCCHGDRLQDAGTMRNAGIRRGRKNFIWKFESLCGLLTFIAASAGAASPWQLNWAPAARARLVAPSPTAFIRYGQYLGSKVKEKKWNPGYVSRVKYVIAHLDLFREFLHLRKLKEEGGEGEE